MLNNIKLVCKRTCLSENNISKSTWIKNKIYDAIIDNFYNYNTITYHVLNSNNEYVIVDKKFYDKYFITLEEFRNNKINNIFKNQ